MAQGGQSPNRVAFQEMEAKRNWSVSLPRSMQTWLKDKTRKGVLRHQLVHDNMSVSFPFPLKYNYDQV